MEPTDKWDVMVVTQSKYYLGMPITDSSKKKITQENILKKLTFNVKLKVMTMLPLSNIMELLTPTDKTPKNLKNN